jgi:multidrug efflux pump subunit AcrA (membrane-fusion protein)
MLRRLPALLFVASAVPLTILLLPTHATPRAAQPRPVAEMPADRVEIAPASARYLRVAPAARSGEHVRVPIEAVLPSSAGEGRVFVQLDPLAYQARPVVLVPSKRRFSPLGESHDGWVEIERGLAPGELLVVDGALLLDAALSQKRGTR